MMTILLLLAVIFWLIPQVLEPSAAMKKGCLIVSFVLVLICFAIAISLITVNK